MKPNIDSRIEDLFIQEALDIDSIKKILAGIAISGSIMLSPGVGWNSNGSSRAGEQGGRQVKESLESEKIINIPMKVVEKLLEREYLEDSEYKAIVKQFGRNHWRNDKTVKEAEDYKDNYSSGSSQGQASLYAGYGKTGNDDSGYGVDDEAQGTKKKKVKKTKNPKFIGAQKLVTHANRDIEEKISDRLTRFI